jgi:hypothetical protein
VDTGGSGEAAAAAQVAASRTPEDQAVVECFEEHAKDEMDDDDEDKVEENLLGLITFCAVDASDHECVEKCIEDIVKKCDDDLNPSGSGSGDDDCKHLDDDLIKCLKDDCYPAE